MTQCQGHNAIPQCARKLAQALASACLNPGAFELEIWLLSPGSFRKLLCVYLIPNSRSLPLPHPTTGQHLQRLA